jgi:hypothetical protein
MANRRAMISGSREFGAASSYDVLCLFESVNRHGRNRAKDLSMMLLRFFVRAATGMSLFKTPSVRSQDAMSL